MTKIDYDKWLIIDTEVSIKNRGDDAVGKHKSSPYCGDNKIVMMGVKSYVYKLEYGIEEPSILTNFSGALGGSFMAEEEDNDFVLVGHNLKFDLLHMYNVPNLKCREWVQAGGKIWDTQLAEYLLEGQSITYPSLDQVAVKYGGTLKDDRIKAFWDADVDTEDIPEEMLKEYLKNDVLNTEIVFKAQVQRAKDEGMLPLIESQMEALVATTEMEWNGMYMDREIAAEGIKKLAKEKAVVQERVIKFMREQINNEMIEPSPTSNDDLSVVLFGGELKYTTQVEVKDEDGNPVRYKTGLRVGEIKTKKVEFIWPVPPTYATKFTRPLKKKGFYSTDDKVLKKIRDTAFGTDEDKQFIEDILELRKINKDLNTYYLGYTALVWPDGRLHGNIHHCSTVTGRLSSSAPNLQNLSSTED